jgi:hypothetical protein
MPEGSGERIRTGWSRQPEAMVWVGSVSGSQRIVPGSGWRVFSVRAFMVGDGAGEPLVRGDATALGSDVRVRICGAYMSNATAW